MPFHDRNLLLSDEQLDMLTGVVTDQALISRHEANTLKNCKDLKGTQKMYDETASRWEGILQQIQEG